jgi:multicomponent Na+:H+ antiporter subunit B
MRSARMIVGGIGVIILVAGFAWGATGLHRFGAGHSRYGFYTAHHAVPQRRTTNSVVAVAFDYRSFDTLGEEFILFISVVGVVVLLRALRDEEEEPEAEGLVPEQRQASEAERWLGAALVGPVALLAAYIVTHGQLTPGGGFQGGIVLMGAVAFVFLGGEWVILMRLRRASSWVEMLEAGGAAGFAMIGFGGLLAAGAFFANFLPFGSPGSLLSGGFIPLANVAVGIEVAGATLMVVSELVDQRLLRARK